MVEVRWNERTEELAVLVAQLATSPQDGVYVVATIELDLKVLAIA